MQPGIPVSGRGFRLAHKMAERAVQHLLLVLVAALELRWLNGVEVAQPGVAIAAPLRMQCGHTGEGAPQWHAGGDEALTQPVEQRSGVGAAQPFADRPDMQFDDLPPERAVEAQREGRHPREARGIDHERCLYRNLARMRNPDRPHHLIGARTPKDGWAGRRPTLVYT